MATVHWRLSTAITSVRKWKNSFFDDFEKFQRFQNVFLWWPDCRIARLVGWLLTTGSPGWPSRELWIKIYSMFAFAGRNVNRIAVMRCPHDTKDNDEFRWMNHSFKLQKNKLYRKHCKHFTGHGGRARTLNFKLWTFLVRFVWTSVCYTVWATQCVPDLVGRHCKPKTTQLFWNGEKDKLNEKRKLNFFAH